MALKLTSSLPAPEGPFQVGYRDVMTLGEPASSVYFRLYYPAPAHTKIATPPLLVDRDTRHGLITFVRAMAWNWPTWVNNKEFLMLPVVKKMLSPKAFSATFNVGWKALGKNLTIPISRGAALEDPPSDQGWPVVVFSHGMGCNRVIMSQLCYQLASQGAMVAALEHRDGSGCGSHYVTHLDGVSIKYPVPHIEVTTDGAEYHTRYQQMLHRRDEIVRTIDILATLNAGESVDIVKDDNSKSWDLNLFKSNMNLTRNLFLLGHSFGGSTVLFASAHDKRPKGVLALDPWMFPVSQSEFTLTTPSLVFNTEKFVNNNNIEVIKRAAKDDTTVQFRVTKSGVHLSPTDVPSIFTSTLIRKGLGFMDKVDPAAVMKETNNVVNDWFKKSIC